MARPLPAALGFRMPAEWEPHAATWLSWPHKKDSWPGHFDPIPAVWVEIVRALVSSEIVNILVVDASMATEVRTRLRLAGIEDGVRLHEVVTDDAWMRDHGPTFVVREGSSGAEVAAIDWGYNAWGGKYPPWENDDAVPRRLCDRLGVRRFEPGIVLEGGSIDVNGAGAVLTSESCLLNPNRNPHLDRVAIERYLRDYLAVDRVLWLGDGIAGDDTDGHIDDMARFVARDTVLAAVETDRVDPNYEPLRANFDRLQRMVLEDGRRLRVVALPMPRPVEFDGQRVPASYANFYIANRAVLVPVFGDPNDETALRVIAEHFPGRRVVGIYAREMVWGLGAIHCVTQQQPVGSWAAPEEALSPR